MSPKAASAKPSSSASSTAPAALTTMRAGVAVEVGVVGHQRRARGRREGGVEAQDGAAQRRVTEGAGLGEVEDPVVRRVARLGDLLADHALLALKLGGVDHRAAHEVSQHLHREARAAGEVADLVAGALVTGGRVDPAALPLDRLDDAAGGARPRALEDHVLEEVAPAVALGRLPPRAGVHHDRQGGALQPRHGVGHDAHAVGQGVEAGCHGRLRRRAGGRRRRR